MLIYLCIINKIYVAYAVRVIVDNGGGPDHKLQYLLIYECCCRQLNSGKYCLCNIQNYRTKFVVRNEREIEADTNDRFSIRIWS